VNSVVKDMIRGHIRVATDLECVSGAIAVLAESLIVSIESGGKVFWAGNGGSAADSQHLAAELVGRFRHDRLAIASIALTTDSSVITAVANDTAFEQVFARQVEALCSPKDFLIGLSTSGASLNVLAALRMARQIGARTALLTGDENQGQTAMADYCIHVPSRDTARIQEMHILVGHILCDLIESAHIRRFGLRAGS